MPDPENSRLARMIARLSVQRAYLDHAANVIADIPGPVFEIGLGKARTYDHLRHLLPDRRIYAFDRSVHCPPTAVPPDEFLVLGDFSQTLSDARDQFEGQVALAHCDTGSEDLARDAAQAAWLADLVEPLVCRGGVILSDRLLALPDDWDVFELQNGPFPYFGWVNR